MCFSLKWFLSIHLSKNYHFYQQVMKNYSMSVELKHDGKNVTCQPLSLFNDIEAYKNQGISPVRKLNVIRQFH